MYTTSCVQGEMYVHYNMFFSKLGSPSFIQLKNSQIVFNANQPQSQVRPAWIRQSHASLITQTHDYETVHTPRVQPR